MGLDRDAGALLIIQSDAPGAARAEEAAVAVAACEVAGAKEVFSTEDPVEGEMFVQARRLHFTAIEVRGNDPPRGRRGARAAAARPARRRRGDRAAPRRRDPGGRPRGGRQHPPGDHPHAGRRGCRAPRAARVRRGHGRRDPARRDDHGGARRRVASRSGPSGTSSGPTSWRSPGGSRTPSTRRASSTPGRSSPADPRRRPSGSWTRGPRGGTLGTSPVTGAGRPHGGCHVVVDPRVPRGHRAVIVVVINRRGSTGASRADDLPSGRDRPDPRPGVRITRGRRRRRRAAAASENAPAPERRRSGPWRVASRGPVTPAPAPTQETSCTSDSASSSSCSARSSPSPSTSTSPGIEDDTLGWILILAGALAIVLSLALAGRRRAGVTQRARDPGRPRHRLARRAHRRRPPLTRGATGRTASGCRRPADAERPTPVRGGPSGVRGRQGLRRRTRARP